MSVSSLLRLRRQLDDENVIPIAPASAVIPPLDVVEETVVDMLKVHFRL